MQPLAERHWRAMLEPREQAQVAVLQTPTFDPDSVFCSTSVGGAPIVSSALGACMDSGSTQHSRRAQGEILITSGGSTPAGGRGTAGGVSSGQGQGQGEEGAGQRGQGLEMVWPVPAVILNRQALGVPQARVHTREAAQTRVPWLAGGATVQQPPPAASCF